MRLRGQNTYAWLLFYLAELFHWVVSDSWFAYYLLAGCDFESFWMMSNPYKKVEKKIGKYKRRVFESFGDS